MNGLGRDDSVGTTNFHCEVCRGSGNERLGGERPSSERIRSRELLSLGREGLIMRGLDVIDLAVNSSVVGESIV